MVLSPLSDASDDLSGEAPLDEACIIAKRLEAAILADGARAAGRKPDNGMGRVRENPDHWFEAVGDGMFRWR